MSFQLTEEQEDGLNKTYEWWQRKDKQVWAIVGGAGTGKTTLIRYIINKIGLSDNQVLFVAYVGKATLALSRKGNKAKTIHSAIYDVVEVPKIENGEVVTINNRPVTEMRFAKKEIIDPNIRLLVVDEAAMVNDEIGKDLMSYGIPIIATGDMNQLPPVFGVSKMLEHPDVILTKPMRQALDDPIIKLAHMALNGEYIKCGRYGERCFVIRKESINANMLMKSDIVICGKNKTRSDINNYIRQDILHITKPYPVVGEKLICRQNNWKQTLSSDKNISLINGLIGYVEKVNLETFNNRSLEIDFRPEFCDNKDDCFFNIAMDYEYFVDPKALKNRGRSYYNKFEFAYAITCHLAQGSEYDKVFIYHERLHGGDVYNRKWLYTAITRAKKTLIIAV